MAQGSDAATIYQGSGLDSENIRSERQICTGWRVVVKMIVIQIVALGGVETQISSSTLGVSSLVEKMAPQLMFDSWSSNEFVNPSGLHQ